MSKSDGGKRTDDLKRSNKWLVKVVLLLHSFAFWREIKKVVIFFHAISLIKIESFGACSLLEDPFLQLIILQPVRLQ
jgi:hypothetical protein